VSDIPTYAALISYTAPESNPSCGRDPEHPGARAALYLRDGHLSKAYQALTSNSSPINLSDPENSSAAILALRILHPHEAPLDSSDFAVHPIDTTNAIANAPESVSPILPSASSPAEPDSPAEPAPPRCSFADCDLSWAIANASRASAPGPSGWRVDFLQSFVLHVDALRVPVLPHFVAAMRRLEAGVGIPADARPYVYGAALSGLSKPGGGLRPIAVGEVFSRVVGKAIAHHNKDAFSSFFTQHHQLGVSVPAGAETIVHATRFALQQPGSVSLQLDFQNAFNSLSRRLILQQLQLHFPHLIPYFMARYGQHTKLPLATAPPGNFVNSCTGVQQGDPMGPFFFALGLTAVTAPLFHAASSDPNHSLHRTTFLCLLDDITIAGLPEDVAFVANSLMDAAVSTQSSLKLNSDKCVSWSYTVSAEDRAAWSTSSLNRQFFSLNAYSDVCFPPCDKGIKLLGSFIGAPSHVRDMLLKSVNDHTPVVSDRLKLLDSLQMRILLLRHCADKKFSSLWRTVPPSLSGPAAATFDNLITGALRECQGFGFLPDGGDAELQRYNRWRSIVRLPVRLGGMSLGSSSMVAPLAYVGSVADASRLILSSPMFIAIRSGFAAWLDNSVSSGSSPCEVAGILSTLHDNIRQHRSLPTCSLFASVELSDPSLLPVLPAHLPTALSKLQHRLCSLSFEMTDTALRGSVSRELSAQLLSQRCPVARGLMSAIPSCAELTAPNDVFGTFLFHFQCMHLIGNPQICCSCTSSAVRSSDSIFRAEPAKHASSCSIGDAFTVRHHQGCMGVKAVLDWIPHAVIYPRFSVNVPEETPDFDVLNVECGKHAFVEYSVVDHLQDALLLGSARTAGHAALKRDSDKWNKYRPLCLSSGRDLYTASQEASGRISKGYSKLIELAVERHDRADFDAIAPSRTWASDSLRAYLQQVIALNYWSGVVAAELQRVRVNASNEVSMVGASLSRPVGLPFSCVNPSRWSATSASLSS